MISSSEGVSDLLFAVGKPPVLEEHGVLEEFPIDTPTGVLDAAQINQIADHVMQGDERLKSESGDTMARAIAVMPSPISPGCA